MKDLFPIWFMYWVSIAISSALAQPYEGRTLPPAVIPDIKEQIEKKRVEMEREETMSVERLGYQLALAHHYVRTHECPEKSHFHDFTVWDEDRIADLILEKYGK